ncbi:MAG: hypothetical protein QXQ18_00875 [Candidatus Aenigmatarchaeota archaeon]
MPVFARTKLVIHDDCLSPAPGSPLPGAATISLKYTGPNPQNLYEQIKKFIVAVFAIPEKDILEREFFWDRSKPDEVFRVTFEFVKDLDAFSFMEIIISLSGVAKPSRHFGKEGSAEIRIEGRLRTEYPQDTLWQRSLLYEMFRVFYHKIIYEEKRKKYKEECWNLINKLQNEIKSFLNILPKTS